MPPPPARPPIPMPMAGGRPQPGSQMRRPGTPTQWPGEVPAGEGAGATHRAFEFSFVSALRPDTPAPATPPAAAAHVGGVPAGAAAAATGMAPLPVPAPASVSFLASPAPRAQGPGAAAAARRRGDTLRASSAPWVGGGLYGQTYLAGQGRTHFDPSPRMDNWLERLQSLSLERQEEDEEEEVRPSAVQSGDTTTGEGVALDAEESTRAGDKRSAPPEDDDPVGPPRRAAKRSRVGGFFERTFSRGGRHRAVTTPALPPDSDGNISGQPAAATTDNPHFARPFSPFGLLSRAGDSPAPSMVASRTIKLCLVGDVGAGKTAFLNRVAEHTFNPTSPSLAPDTRSVLVRTASGALINVELWDFPGVVGAVHRPGPLLSTFFHAAIICFSLEDRANLASIGEAWKPRLTASLHEEPVLVLGLQRDKRPTFLPPLALSFLPPTATPVSSSAGQRAAVAIGAHGYGECSARTGDNVRGALEGIVEFVVGTVEEREAEVRRGRGVGVVRKVGRWFSRGGLGL